MRLAGLDLVGAFRERIREGPGATLRVSPDPDHLHLFDGLTGQRIEKD